MDLHCSRAVCHVRRDRLVRAAAILWPRSERAETVWAISIIQEPSDRGMCLSCDWICNALAYLAQLGMGDPLCGFRSYDGSYRRGTFAQRTWQGI